MKGLRPDLPLDVLGYLRRYPQGLLQLLQVAVLGGGVDFYRQQRGRVYLGSQFRVSPSCLHHRPRLQRTGHLTEDEVAHLLVGAHLVELTDDDALGVVDQGRVDEAISAAQGEVDGYLAERYTVPLSPVPPLVKAACEDIAIYNLYSRTQDEIPESRKTRYAGAVRLLEKLASGAISLGIADPPEPAAADNLTVSAGERIFPDDVLDTY